MYRCMHELLCNKFNNTIAGGTDYVIASTSIITGDRLIDGLTQTVESVSLNPFET